MQGIIMHIKCRKTIWYFIFWLLIKTLQKIKDKKLLSVKIGRKRETIISIDEVFEAKFIEDEN